MANTSAIATCNCSDIPCTPQSLINNATITSVEQPATTVLKVLTLDFKTKDVEFLGANFEAFKGGSVKVDVTNVTGFGTLFSEIENDSRLGLGLFDAYVTPPVIMGTAVQYDGFADMTDYITENYLNEWLDILPGYRDIISTYNSEILMMPFDGDVFHLYYNKEVLSYYNLDSPRTWDEYNTIAEQVHGKVFPLTNKTLIGSCIGRVPQCAGPYWAVQVLSSMTQTKGSYEGGLFDTKDMNPLTDEALIETLKIIEQQHKYGHPDELKYCIFEVNQDSMAEEECVLTYNWGNSYALDLIRGKLGISKTPGSTKVLDRTTGKLVKCDLERCPHATFYDDIGFVNYAPYAAFGGWGGAVSSNIPQDVQSLAIEFLAFSASKEESRKYIQPKVGTPESKTGFDPFRKSHIDVDAFVSQGYDKDTTTAYLGSIAESLSSPNLATDIRFPEAATIHAILDTNIINHLNDTKGTEVTDQMRSDVVQNVNEEWTKTIESYDSKGDTIEPILVQYQRLRGVYVSENENENLIGDVRWIGYALGIVIILLSFGFGGWVAYNRKHRVIKISQPIFLLLVIFGVLVLSSAIFPLGIDDSVASQEGCDAACVSIPWLVSLGFSLIFAALFSKLWRINRVFSAAKSMKRVVITEKDVLKPLVALMSLNIIILLSWTLVDPPVFERVQIDELTSYGRCISEGTAWKGFISALAVLNFLALILANVQSYKARSINDELSESKYIGLSTLSMLQIFIVGVPLLVIVYTSPSAYFFVWTGIIFIVCTSILLLIFVPKLVTWKNPPKKNNSSGSKWSSYGSAVQSPTSKASGVLSHQSSVVSEVETKKDTSSIPEKQGDTKRVSFSDKQSDLIYRAKLDEIKEKVLNEHNIDISSILLKLYGEEGIARNAREAENDVSTVKDEAATVQGEIETRTGWAGSLTVQSTIKDETAAVQGDTESA